MASVYSKLMTKGLLAGVVAAILLLFMTGCGTQTDTHFSLQEIVDKGWVDDEVELEVVRIDPEGEVTYSEQFDMGFYSFRIYDQSTTEASQYITVVADEDSLDFEPEPGAFLALEGDLRSSVDQDDLKLQQGWHYRDETEEALYISAVDMSAADRPGDW